MSICVESLLYVTAFPVGRRCLSEPNIYPPRWYLEEFILPEAAALQAAARAPSVHHP